MKPTFIFILLPLLAAALPTDMSASSPLEAAIDARKVETRERYCLTGFSERRFSGESSTACCFWGQQCCPITDKRITSRILSGKARGTHSIFAYTGIGCTGKMIEIDQDGWRDLSGQATAFRSMSEKL